MINFRKSWIRKLQKENKRFKSDIIIYQNCRNIIVDENEKLKNNAFKLRTQVRKMDKEIKYLEEIIEKLESNLCPSCAKY